MSEIMSASDRCTGSLCYVAQVCRCICMPADSESVCAATDIPASNTNLQEGGFCRREQTLFTGFLFCF